MNKPVELLNILQNLSATNKGITIISEDQQKKKISYKDLWNRSRYFSEILEKQGLKRNSEVIIRCEHLESFIYSFWACAIGGFVCIPLDASQNEMADSLLRHIMETVDIPVIISDFMVSSDSHIQIINPSSFYKNMYGASDYPNIEYPASPDSILYVLYSSGTTGTPSGVVINKSNALENAWGTINHFSLTKEDKFLTWSPLTHCFGLITYHITPIVLGADQCLISTKLYMRNPTIWLDTINDFRATVMNSVPFALNLLKKHLQNSDTPHDWDLSCVKSIMLGGEQVHKTLFEQFCRLTEKYGLTSSQISPIYGLTEATVLVCCKKPGDIVKNYMITNENLLIGDKVHLVEISELEETGESFLEMGTAFENVDIQIRDDESNILPDGYLGHIYVNGPCVTSGYFKNSALTNKIIKEDGWLLTGDLGITQNGRLIIVGREKDMVVANGKKISCLIIENLIQKLLESTTYKECVVCNGFYSYDENEQVIVFILADIDPVTEQEKKLFLKMKETIRSSVFNSTGVTIGEIVPIDTIPKTSSGKAFRRKLAEAYNAGDYKTKIKLLNQINNDGKNIMEINAMNNYQSESSIAAQIAKIMEQVFGIKVTNNDATFVDLGIVSINIPTFVDRLNSNFGIKLQVSDMFSYFTINGLTKRILSLANTSKQQISGVSEDRVMEDIAIVGMSCRLPGGANNIDSFWELLTSERNGVSEVPESRWELEKYYEQDTSAPGKMYCKRGGFLDTNINEFDARFFNISPKEAEALDPQQRMLLELTWEAFENANIDISRYSGTDTGVYVALSHNEFHLAQLHSGNPSSIGAYTLTGVCASTACGRLSYTFGFEGPCVAIDTACSSTLTALHLAFTAMQAGEASLQVVAGINLMQAPTTSIGFSKLQATSTDGYSKAFDASANGYSRGEGGGVIILKKVSDAIKDNDQILGIVKATGINQDGHSNGLTAPNGDAQEKLIRKTLTSANIDSRDVDYVEMHGTGTKLGDPIEFSAVSATYGQNRTDENLLRIGSVKSNIGHLEASAGIASIAKVLLAMKHNLIPANLHFKTPNPLIDWEGSKIAVVDNHIPWLKENGLRTAAINGFGFGGSNAHTIIQEYKGQHTNCQNDQISKNGINYILKISAKTKTALYSLIKSYRDLISGSTDHEFANIIYTANTGRTDLDYRFAVCGSSRESLIEKIENYLQNDSSEGVFTNLNHDTSPRKDKKVVMMFTGQGSQYINMGRILYETNDVFKSSLDKCDTLFRPFLLKSLVDLIYGEKACSEVIENTVYAQPLIFAIEYALFNVWSHFGVKPEIVTGHSIGEYAAAVVSGILCLEDAVKLVSTRGRLMAMAPGKGAMATVFADESNVRKLLQDYNHTVTIAARNAKDSYVISGYEDDLQKILDAASLMEIPTKKLIVSHAFHSMMMEPILDDFRMIADEIHYNSPSVKFVSALYGKEIDEIPTSDYWTRHIRETVKFYESIESIQEKEGYIFLEVGSNRVLSSLAKLIVDEDDIAIVSTLNIKKSDNIQLSESIAELYVNGYSLHWNEIKFTGNHFWRKATLPNYPYDKVLYATKLHYDREGMEIGSSDFSNVLGQRIDLPDMNNSIVFQRKFTATEPYYMKEHVIFGSAISPAAAHVSMVLSAIKETINVKSCVLRDIEFRVPLAAKDEEQRQVQVCINKSNDKSTFSIISREFDTNNWLVHAKGGFDSNDTYQLMDLSINTKDYENLSPNQTADNTIYKYMERSGFELGDGFKRIKNIQVQENSAYFEIEALDTVPYFKDYVLYPGTMDSIFQTAFLLVLEQLKDRVDAKTTVIPYFFEKMTFNYRPTQKLWCRCESVLHDEILYANMLVFNELGESLIKLENLMFKLTDSDSLLRESKSISKMYYHIDWVKDDETEEQEVTNSNNDDYLIISDDLPFSDVLAEGMRAGSASVTTAYLSQEIENGDIADFIIEPENRENWISMLNHVMKKSKENHLNILYCAAKADSSEDCSDEMDYSSVKSLLILTQILDSEGFLNRSKIKIITRNAQRVGDMEYINLSASFVWGFSKVLSIEYPKLYNGIIDLDGTVNGKIISQYILGDSQVENVIRAGVGFTSKLISHSDYAKQNIKDKKSIILDKNASYLITGGTGAVGLAYAEELSNNGARNIILLCRKNPGENAIDIIDGLEKAGVKVYIAYADICEFGELKAALFDAAKKMPPIRGIVHAAGILKDRMIADTDWNDFEQVLRPKVTGSFNLYRLIDMDNLDFFMMTSSITSVIGNAGQSSYAAGNYFMNAFAQYLDLKQIPGYSLCWGPWGTKGMAASNDAVSNAMKRMGLNVFQSEFGKRIIGEYLERPFTNLLIADIDWSVTASAFEDAAGKKEFLSKLITEKDFAGDNAGGGDLINVLDTYINISDEEKHEFMIRTLQEICGKIMGFGKDHIFSVNDTFRDQGADSLMIFTMRTAINKSFSIDINVATFFNYPTIKALSTYLIEGVLKADEDISTETENRTEDILSEIDFLIGN